MQGVEVAEGTGNLSSVEPGSGLQEDPLSLKMVEKLEKEQTASVNSCLKYIPSF